MATTVEALSAQHIAEQVRRVAELRRQRDEVKATIASARAAFEENIKSQTDQADRIGSDLMLAEAELRTMTLAHYERTKEPKPTVGVQVTIHTVPVYDIQKADEWTREHRCARIPEQLDRKAFEKIAKVMPLDFVEMRKEPRVRVATNLDKALAQDAQ